MLDSIYGVYGSIYDWFYNKDNLPKPDPNLSPYDPPYKV
jgi:hypothetical protein